MTAPAASAATSYYCQNQHQNEPSKNCTNHVDKENKEDFVNVEGKQEDLIAEGIDFSSELVGVSELYFWCHNQP